MTPVWAEEIFAIHERAVKKKIVPWSIEDTRFLALALAGEVGELANRIKEALARRRRPWRSTL